MHVLESAGEDPLAVVHEYFDNPVRLKSGQAWRASVTYRCKNSHLLSHVLNTPSGYVLYSLRRGKKSGLGEPGFMVGLLPELDGENGDFDMALGSCKCQPVRTRYLADMWADVERRKPREIRI